MWNAKSYSRAAGLAALALAATPVLPAQNPAPDDVAALREQIRLLDQKLKALERNLELKDEAALAEARKQPKLTVSDGRVEVASADGKNSFRLRGLVQADARLYLDDANAAQDGFVLRRARLGFEGRFGDIFEYVVLPEFGGTVQLLDANVNAVFSPAAQLRVGRFKTPIGLEQLQSDPVAFFNERSVATNLTPNRDVGAQLHGDLFGKRLNYAVGVFNGVLDGGNSPTTNLNDEGDFTVVGRLFATPFANDKDSALQGLGFGLAVGGGNYDRTTLNAYRTDGQQSFFAYRGATVAAGRGLVLSPQAYYYHGPLGILAEYVSSTVTVANGANRRELTNDGFNLSAGYVLTGENASYRGVAPASPFNPSTGNWGAFEIVARVASVDIDDDAFIGGAGSLANPSTAASGITTYGVGLNWYLTKSVRAGVNLFHNTFDLAPGAAPAAGSVLSDDETTLITRFQVSF